MAAGMALTLIVGACGRDDEEAAPTTTVDGPETTVPAAVGLDAGAFGDLGVVCGPAPEGMALTDSDVGVTADSIQVSTFSDPGFVGRPGLNQELFDTAEAFTAWCNEKGGISGRRIELQLRDAMLTQFQQRIIEACSEGDFMMVGGGAVFDDTGQAERLACGLPTVAGYVVTKAASAADLTYQPAPNPTERMQAGDLQYLGEKFPESTTKVGAITADVATTMMIAGRNVDGLEQMGWTVVYNDTFPAAGVDTWRIYVESMRAAGVRGLLWIGDPVNLAKLLAEADAVGYEFDWVRGDPNNYDLKLLADAGDAAEGFHVVTGVPPFLDGAAEPGSAGAQYVELIERYDEGGVQALLGLQGLSSWLLFATAVRDCGADVTRDCVFEKIGQQTAWTGGGLHAPADIASGRSSSCFASLVVKNGAFVLADIETTDGIFNCDPDNMLELDGDYGDGAKCPNTAYVDDPKPSNCANT
jgi:ABC-type branched-subunit amino acid transport system substrate-binding protein